ncbi:hypothetical protein [Pigmentiphaga litoralis]|uniref:Uncharacterized protein n=1 Tax=Pigmentiphaga litoralis TaxID=516702 RepID=A0A7Y9LKU3_9BURK|nr:hypothetical protein [Pigmentiphaga litoralis]NYE24529.1 hypothetical protein [Pigmentiphaga litoralis]NYE81857.1 hypothetical protein [Pigmentiphaga litoralis]
MTKILILLLLVFQNSALSAGEAVKTEVAEQIVGKTLNIALAENVSDGVQVTLSMDETDYIPGPISGRIIVKNTRNERLTISDWNVYIIGSLSSLYSQSKITTGEIKVEPNSAYTLDVYLRPGRKPTMFEHITFRSGPTKMTVNLIYFADGMKSGQTNYSLQAELKTSPFYTIAGGFFGALLLIVFVIVSKIIYVAQKNELTALISKLPFLCVKWFIVSIAYAVNGLIVTILLITLSAGLMAFQLPISFKLQDFSGGLIVGLFSITLGKFLADKLAVAIPSRSLNDTNSTQAVQ